MASPTEAHLEWLSRRWELHGPLRFIRKVENFVYEVVGGELIVRITSPQSRSLELLSAEVAWMEYLDNHQLRLASVVPSLAGTAIERLGDGDDSFYAVVFERAAGASIDPGVEPSPRLLRSWGAYLGAMHRATREFEPGANRRPDWRDFPSTIQALAAVRDGDGAGTRFLELVDCISEKPRSNDTYGLIHADFHHGNFFVDGDGNITAFDFDDCQYHFFAYDLAVALSALVVHGRVRGVPLAIETLYPEFIAGYVGATPRMVSLSEIELFARFRAALVYHWCMAQLIAGHFDAAAIDWAKKVMPILDEMC